MTTSKLKEFEDKMSENSHSRNNTSQSTTRSNNDDETSENSHSPAATDTSYDEADKSSDPPSRVRIFLQSRIKNHPIWKEIRFWEESFFDSLNQKTKKDKRSLRSLFWHSDTEQAEALNTQKNVVFSCLGTYAHNMREFDMDRESAINFVKKMSSINELDEDQIDMLLQLDCLSSDPIAAGTAMNSRPLSSNSSTSTASNSRSNSARTSMIIGEDSNPDVSAELSFSKFVSSVPIPEKKSIPLKVDTSKDKKEPETKPPSGAGPKPSKASVELISKLSGGQLDKLEKAVAAEASKPDVAQDKDDDDDGDFI